MLVRNPFKPLPFALFLMGLTPAFGVMREADPTDASDLTGAYASRAFEDRSGAVGRSPPAGASVTTVVGQGAKLARGDEEKLRPEDIATPWRAKQVPGSASNSRLPSRTLGFGRELANARVEMRAFQGDGRPLSDLSNVYFVLMDSKNLMPVVKRHLGEAPVVFTRSEAADPTPFVGIYYPGGYSVSYRSTVSANPKCVAPSRVTQWKIYDDLNGDRKQSSTLQLGAGQGLPELTEGKCLVIEWLVDETNNPRYLGFGLTDRQNQRHELTVLPNGTDNKPITKVLEQGQRGAGKIRVEVSEPFGAMMMNFSIKPFDTGSYTQLIKNGNVPTDMGWQNSILVWNGIRGAFAKNDTVTTSPSNQMAGHGPIGKRFGNFEWGMNCPLVKEGDVLRSPPGLWIPMYSDAVSPFDEGPDATNPFFRPRSVRLWDARIAEMALRPYSKNGSTVQMFSRVMQFRAHKDLRYVNNGGHSGIDFWQHGMSNREPLLDSDGMVYLVWSDGTYTKQFVKDMDRKRLEAFCKDSNPSRVLKNRNVIDSRGSTLGMFDCIPGADIGAPKLLRYIMDLTKQGIAMSIQAENNQPFPKSQWWSRERGSGLNVLVSFQASLHRIVESRSIKKGDIFTVGINYFVAPLNVLGAAGVGLPSSAQ